MENCLKYDTIHDFSVWLRSSSNPADIKRIGSHTGKYILINQKPLTFTQLHGHRGLLIHSKNQNVMIIKIFYIGGLRPFIRHTKTD